MNKYRMDHVIEHCTNQGNLFVVYGKDTNGEHGELTGTSMCVWMVPETLKSDQRMREMVEMSTA